MGPKNVLKKILVWEKFWVRKYFGSEKILKKIRGWEKSFWVLPIFYLKNVLVHKVFFESNKIDGPQILGLEKLWVCKKFWSQKFWSKDVPSKKIFAQKLCPKKIGFKKFGQNWTCNSWDNGIKDKCHQGIDVAWTNVTMTFGIF